MRGAFAIGLFSVALAGCGEPETATREPRSFAHACNFAPYRRPKAAESPRFPVPWSSRIASPPGGTVVGARRAALACDVPGFASAGMPGDLRSQLRHGVLLEEASLRRGAREKSQGPELEAIRARFGTYAKALAACGEEPRDVRVWPEDYTACAVRYGYGERCLNPRWREVTP